MLAIKSDARCRFKQKESNAQWFERNLLKTSHPFFTDCAQCFTYPSPFSILFPSSIFFIPFSKILLFSLLNVFYSPPPLPHLFYIFFHPQIHRPPSDSPSTPHPPYIDPIKTIEMRRRWRRRENNKIVEEGIITLRRENNAI